jgi:hypothetical protein
MASYWDTLSRLEKLRQQLGSELGRIADVAKAVEGRVEEINRMEWFSPDERARRVEAARDDALREVQAARASADGILEQRRHAVNELRAARPTTDSARQQVTRLLDAGEHPDELVKRALELADRELLAAIPLVAAYDGISRKPGIGNQRQYVDVETTDAAVNSAFAELTDDQHERSALRAANDIGQVAQEFDAAHEFAAKMATSGRGDRLAYAYGAPSTQENASGEET